MNLWQTGTSPRMWGKPGEHFGFCILERNIPTHVGKTRRAPRAFQGRTEHPHACGENAVLPDRPALRDGTSPRMWGKQRRHRRNYQHRRNIPTHVGKTSGCVIRTDTISEHPHACGENSCAGQHAIQPPGTSPRMWGKRIRGRRTDLIQRNIPTHVGKTHHCPR